MLTGRHHRGGDRWTLSVYILFIGIILQAVSACSPKIIERVVVQRDTLQVHHRDSIFTKDSVYIREWMKGDTVYLDRFRDRYIYKDRWRDSIQVRERHDTTTVEVKVERELSWAQRAKIKAFPWLMLSVIGAMLWIFRKYIF